MENKMLMLLNVSSELIKVINTLLYMYNKSFVIQVIIEAFYDITGSGVELYNGLIDDDINLSDVEYYKTVLCRLNIKLFLTLDIIIEREVRKIVIKDIYTEGNIIIIKGSYV